MGMCGARKAISHISEVLKEAQKWGDPILLLGHTYLCKLGVASSRS
jgi:hypothetical protein